MNKIISLTITEKEKRIAQLWQEIAIASQELEKSTLKLKEFERRKHEKNI